MADTTSTNTATVDAQIVTDGNVDANYTSAPNQGVSVPGTVGSGQRISASTFAAMANVLNNLVNHTHTYYDDFTTVCDCQCQCDLSLIHI